MSECDHEDCAMAAEHHVEVCEGVDAEMLDLCDHHLLSVVSSPHTEVRRPA